MKCYKFIDNGPSGNKPQFTVNLYTFYPEEGPKGTPGRGPYCVGSQRIHSSNVDAAKAHLASLGAVSLPDESNIPIQWTRIGEGATS